MNRRIAWDLLDTGPIKVLPSQQSEATVYDTVYGEIIRIFSPAGNNPVNRQIQTAWRNAMVEAEETSAVATAARMQAIDSLKQHFEVLSDIVDWSVINATGWMGDVLEKAVDEFCDREGQ